MDVQDLDNPIVVDTTRGVGDRPQPLHPRRQGYAANYFAGIQVLDIVDPSTARSR